MGFNPDTAGDVGQYWYVVGPRQPTDLPSGTVLTCEWKKYGESISIAFEEGVEQ